jgi:NDP-sugar pyrophosphorylase family protein
MVDVDGRPFLDILVEWAASEGMTRFIFSSGHKADVIRKHFKPVQGREYLFSEEKEPLGTGGALKLCESLLKKKPCLVMNGDTYCALDLPGLMKFHDAKKAVATISLAPAKERTDGGFVSMDRENRITSFAEKDPAGGAWLNAGILALGPEVFSSIPAGKACSLERDVLPKMLSQKICGFATDAPLYDIGTPERLEIFRGKARQGL